jgi:hypothetical protein
MENQRSQPAGAAGGGEVINKMKSDAAGLAQDVKRQGEEQFESHKHTAAEQTERLAEVVDRAVEGLRDQDQQSLADYAGELAGSMKNFAESLRGRSLDDLVRDTQQLARKNPTLFVMGSVVAGIALSRFLKASAERSDLGGGSEARPVTFESRPAVTSGSASPTPSAPGESPFFADDLEKGV